MRSSLGPLGQLLLNSGALTEETLADVLSYQQRFLPIGSLAYVLGYLTEEALAKALSRHYSVPSLVLDRCIIRLDVLSGVTMESAIAYGVLPVYEDDRRIFVAADNPRRVTNFLHELGFLRGKLPIVHVALHITLARTIRACYAALGRGDAFLYGSEADPASAGELGRLYVVSDLEPSAEHPSAPNERITGEFAATTPVATNQYYNNSNDESLELPSVDLTDIQRVRSELAALDRAATMTNDGSLAALHQRPISVPRAETYSDIGNAEDTQTGMSVYTPGEHDTDASAITNSASTSTTAVTLLAPSYPDDELRLNLDENSTTAYTPRENASRRVLIVDDDFATRHLLVKTLQPEGFITATSSSGSDAVRQIRANPPDLVIIDAMLPELDGFQVCRAIKQSRNYNRITVILMSAVIDSGRVTDEALRRYGADAYFAKPLDIARVRESIDLFMSSPGSRAATRDDKSFERAIYLYKDGDIDSAISLLREGLAADPMSAKHHFVLANLLQKKSLIYEAIDEYEATIDLKPDYFPALTRLAYLYYKKGFTAKAIEIWRRSLPHCEDQALRQNIEMFMRKLIADMKHTQL